MTIKHLHTSIILFASLLMLQCTANNKKESPIPLEIHQDNKSFSNYKKVISTNLHVELDIHFENATIYGIARHTIKRKSTDSLLILDTRSLQIQKVTLGLKGKETSTDYTLGIEDSTLGAPLTIHLSKNHNQVNIYYQTSPENKSLNWINTDSSKTKNTLLIEPGKKFVRNWIPTQDILSHQQKLSYSIKSDKAATFITGLDQKKDNKQESTIEFESINPIKNDQIGLLVGSFKKLQLTSKSDLIYDRFSSTDKKNCLNAINTFTKLQEELAINKLNTHILLLPAWYPFDIIKFNNTTCINKQIINNNQLSKLLITRELLNLKSPFSSRPLTQAYMAGIHTGITHFTIEQTNTLTTDQLLTYYHSKSLNPSYYIPFSDYDSTTTNQTYTEIRQGDFSTQYALINDLTSICETESTIHFMKNHYFNKTQFTTTDFEKELYLFIKNKKLDHLIQPINNKTRYFIKNTKQQESTNTLRLITSQLLLKKQSKRSNLKLIHKLKQLKENEIALLLHLLPTKLDDKKIEFLNMHLQLSTHKDIVLQLRWSTICLASGNLSTIPTIENLLRKNTSINILIQFYSLLNKYNLTTDANRIYSGIYKNYPLTTQEILEKHFMLKHT